MAKAIHSMIRVLNEAKSVAFYEAAFNLTVADRLDFESFTLVYMSNPDAGSCYAAAQNSGKDLQEIGLAPPKFTCVPVAGNKELKLIVPEQQGARFPF